MYLPLATKMQSSKKIMKYLIKALEKRNNSLILPIKKLTAELQHKLTLYPNESLGIKSWPKSSLYSMKINDAKLDKMIEECLEDSDTFEERYGNPEGWDIYQVFDVLALLGEFSPLTPLKIGNTSKNLARALMQMIEAYNDRELYIGRETGFPQRLNQFENVANWLLKHHLVNPNATRPIKKVAPEGMFHASSVQSLLKDYERIK
jgi:hypothetical protein